MSHTNLSQYEVDGEKECYNSAQPSTTLCPLLPGQAVNVLEIPTECARPSNAVEDSSAFTRNPKDRYLTPVPPSKPLPSPRPRSSYREAHVLPLPSPWAPKSATYPPADQFLSPNVTRHARSASASPLLPSAPLFADFKELKDKFASKRARSRSRSSSDIREMQISAPVLISTTADGVLPTGEPSPPRSPKNFSRPQRLVSPPLSIPTITRDLSPLASHPVHPSTDSQCFIAELPANETPARRRSCIPTTAVSETFDIETGRHRANSADTRRTKRTLHVNDPWIVSPRFKHDFDSEIQQAREVQFFKPAPVLRRPNLLLTALAQNERPSSSYGGHDTKALRDAVPALRQHLTPAQPSTCMVSAPNQTSPTEEAAAEGAVIDDILQAYEDEEEPTARISEKQRSRFSTWSSFDSYATSDDEGIMSPIFSAATSVSSDAGSPVRQSMCFSYADHGFTKAKQTTTIAEVDEEEDDFVDNRTSTPPQLDLDTLRLSVMSFSSDLFNLDIQHAEAMPRRQAACFGMGFQGYSLPESETKSKETIQSEETIQPKRISVHRESSTSQLDMLMDDFSYLGDAVV